MRVEDEERRCCLLYLIWRQLCQCKAILRGWWTGGAPAVSCYYWHRYLLFCVPSAHVCTKLRLDNSNLVGLWRSWRKIMTTFNSVRHSQRVIIIIQVNFGNRKIHWILGYYFPIRFEFNWVNKLIINYFNPHHHHQSQNILLFFKGHQLLFWN